MMALQLQKDELSPFMLDVEGLEEAAEREERQAINKGSYGYVFKVTVKGVECVAKRLHSVFVSQSNSLKERKSIIEKFRDECIILSKLRHPNIVQFLGVHCSKLHGYTDLTLIMESVRCDMDNFLTEHHDVPLSLKISILQDVSFGLVYLHEYNPPIVHRDLTARNVLVSDKCQAKIADLGMAKLVSFQQQMKESHTKTPGNMFYMPPEAMKEEAACTPKLDIFSFGHLTIFAVTQTFPSVDYHVDQTPTMKESGTIERARRANSLKAVGSDHCLYSIIIECLFDRPDQRLTTRDLNKRLGYIVAQNPVPTKDILPQMRRDSAGAQLKVEGEVESSNVQETINHLEDENVAIKLDFADGDCPQKEQAAILKRHAVGHQMQNLQQSHFPRCSKGDQAKGSIEVINSTSSYYGVSREACNLLLFWSLYDYSMGESQVEIANIPHAVPYFQDPSLASL